MLKVAAIQLLDWNAFRKVVDHFQDFTDNMVVNAAAFKERALKRR